MITDQLHSALKIKTVKQSSRPGLEITLTSLQNSKTDTRYSVHVRPLSFSTSGNQTTDFLAYLGFRRNPCSILPPECYVREISKDFDTELFGDVFIQSFAKYKAATLGLEACGIYIAQPEGWGYFNGSHHRLTVNDIFQPNGDGHTSPVGEQLKSSEDQHFRFIFTGVSRGKDTGWVTHYAPKHPPLSPEFSAALQFIGHFRAFEKCQQFTFEPCHWRFIRYDGNGEPTERNQFAYKAFGEHSSRFSRGTEKFLEF